MTESIWNEMPVKLKVENISLIFAVVMLALAAQTVASVAQTKSFAYRTSNAQAFSNTLGVNCVPAYVMLNKVANQGIFITSAPTGDLGKKMNLSPGMVLLTVDNYSMISARAVDSWLSHRAKRGPITFTYATDNNGSPQVQSGSVQAEVATARSASSGSTAGASSGSASPIASRNVLSIPSAGGSVSSLMLSLLNKSRAAGGLGPLQADPVLSRFAQSYADYLAANAGKYDVRDANNNPHQDLNGRGAIERAQQAGISNFLNENIGRNVGNSGLAGIKILHEQMMDSPGHRPAIMDADAHLVGIGATYAGNRLFLVEEFGR